MIINERLSTCCIIAWMQRAEIKSKCVYKISKDLRHKLDNSMKINQIVRLACWPVGRLVGINQTKAHVNNLWQICNFMRRNKLIEINILSLFIIFSFKLYSNKRGTWPNKTAPDQKLLSWNNFKNKLTYIIDNLN